MLKKTKRYTVPEWGCGEYIYYDKETDVWRDETGVFFSQDPLTLCLDYDWEEYKEEE